MHPVLIWIYAASLWQAWTFLWVESMGPETVKYRYFCGNCDKEISHRKFNALDGLCTECDELHGLPPIESVEYSDEKNYEED